MTSIIMRLLLVGDGLVLYLLYVWQMQSEEERWLQGIGNMPDKDKIRKTYLLIWGVLQIIKVYWIVVGISNFPGQR